MQNNQKVEHYGFRDSAFLLNLLVTGDATTLTPFLRRGFGVEAFRHSGLVALVMILLYAGAYNSVEMYWFLLDHASGNRCVTGHFRCHQAASAEDPFVPVFDSTQQDWLQETVFLDLSRQLGHRFVVEPSANLLLVINQRDQNVLNLLAVHVTFL